LDNFDHPLAITTLAHVLIVFAIGIRVVMKRPAPGVAFAWLLLVVMLPFAGALLYLLIGERRVGPERRHRIDAMVRLRGSLVAPLGVTVLGDWMLETGTPVKALAESAGLHRVKPHGTANIQVVPSGPGETGDGLLQMLLALMHAAHQELVLTTPYLVPDDSLTADASRRRRTGGESESDRTGAGGFTSHPPRARRTKARMLSSSASAGTDS
jgi:hypothetical protein